MFALKPLGFRQLLDEGDLKWLGNDKKNIVII